MKDVVFVIDVLLTLISVICIVGNLTIRDFGTAWLWMIPTVIFLFNIKGLME